MTTETMLKIENLVKYFPVPGKRNTYVHAVDNVSFEIKKGETLGLVGESGCGKSTTAKTIIRMYKPTSGSIILDGQDISALSQRKLKPIRKKIQMVFQDPYSSLNPRMTVLELIAEPLIAQGLISKTSQARDDIVSMLTRVGLTAVHVGRYPHEFSGGQRQRICLARALILEPDLVICDEPISALDVSIQAQVVNLLQKFKKEQNLTYLFIAHDLSMVRYVSDRVGVMYLGKLVELCDSEKIYDHPMHPYTKGLLNAVPIPDPVLAKQKTTTAIKGDLPSPIHPPAGCRFHTRCDQCMQICKEQEPQMKDTGNGHLVACHLYTD
jgi:oligopeptide transport system ATP-binding protein